MARTNRKAALAAQNAASVDALDDLNLDDMFNEGDDTLFDGLEIDLDGMGEMTNNSSSEKKKTVAKPSQNLDAMKLDLLGNSSTTAAATATTEAPKRRTTKRKIKAPPPPDDDDDEDYELPKKKRRASKASTKKGKGTKVAGKAGKASSAKSKASSTMLPPLSRGTPLDPRSMAAGQKKGTSSQQLVRQASGSSAASRASTGSVPEAPFVMPRESPYCGIHPTSTEFYPFMPAVPAEATLNKAHRTPLFQSISTCFTSNLKAPHNESLDTKESDGIQRLLSTDLDLMVNDKTTQATDDVRRASLGQKIGTARTVVSQADKNQLMKDLYSVSSLLKRQYDFLNMSMANMERWCRQNYSIEDYQAAFGLEPLSTSSNEKRRSRSTGRSTPRRAGTLLASLKSPIVKVKVKCSGFKAPSKVQLIAHVRIPGMAPPFAKSDSSRKSSKKRRISPVADLDRLSVPGSSVPEVPVVKEVTYSDMKPFQRRHRVADAVAEKAQSLEAQIKESREKHRRAIERQRAEQQKVVDDDEIVSLNTMTMWKWLEKSPHFASYSESDLRDVLESVWESELVESGLTGPEGTMQPIKEQPPAPTSSDTRPGDSVFLRLQSLLIDEGSDDDEEDEAEDLFMVGDSDVSQSGTSSNIPSKESVVVDLSRLSLDERALIHLRAAGLVDDIESVLDASRKGATVVTPAGESDVDDVILAMQKDLVDQRRINNSRLGFLETAAMSNLESMKELKRREEENASMIARYNQLLKKQKEAKKNARQKPVKGDSDWVPW